MERLRASMDTDAMPIEPGYAPSETNTTILSVATSATSVATDLAAATAPGTGTPHAALSTGVLPIALLFSSSQNGRLLLGGSGVGSSAAAGQAIQANTLYELIVAPDKRYFRFTNTDATTAALTAWTNPNVA